MRLTGDGRLVEKNVIKTPKLVGSLPTTRIIMRNSFKVKVQRSRSPDRLILRPEVRHIFRTERPTNLDYRWTTKTCIIDKRHDRKCVISSGWEGLRTSNFIYRWSMKSRITCSAMTSKVKGHGDEVTWSVRLAHKSRTKSPRNSKIGRKLVGS